MLCCALRPTRRRRTELRAGNSGRRGRASQQAVGRGALRWQAQHADLLHWGASRGACRFRYSLRSVRACRPAGSVQDLQVLSTPEMASCSAPSVLNTGCSVLRLIKVNSRVRFLLGGQRVKGALVCVVLSARVLPTHWRPGCSAGFKCCCCAQWQWHTTHLSLMLIVTAASGPFSWPSFVGKSGLGWGGK